MIYSYEENTDLHRMSIDKIEISPFLNFLLYIRSILRGGVVCCLIIQERGERVMDICGTLQQVSVLELRPRDWVKLLCRDTRGMGCCPEGIFTAGGEVVGVVHTPLAECYRRQGFEVVVVLDPVIEGKAYFIRFTDINEAFRIDPLVRDD